MAWPKTLSMKFVSFVLLCLVLSTTSAKAGIPKHWAKTGYAYETQSNTLALVLKDFARAFGLQVVLTGTFTQPVKGKFRADSATAFLDRLALEHGFQWFVFNGKLHISDVNDHAVERVEVGELTAGALKKALSAVGLLDKRFGWGELPADGVVLVSGPRQYVAFVRSLAKGKHDKRDKSHVLTYKLRYASVADRTIRYRDRSITIPGVASVLSQILSGKRKPSVETQNNPTEKSNQQTQSRAAGVEAIDKFQSLLGGSRKSKLVTMDIRNNLILINDTPDKRSRYQNIINKLDTPLQLMEISAVIIDVSRDRLKQLGINWLFADTAETLNHGSALVVKRLGDFLLRLNALQSQGEVQITASPSVMTQENHPAVIDLSQSVFQTATGERVAEFNKVTAGTSLQVIPRTVQNDDGKAIQLVVDIEDGKLLPAINDDLVVQTSNISTQAVIKDGHALVLGGFQIQRKERQNSQIPLLADVPYLGALFNNQSQSRSDQQRLFILVPRFISDDHASELPKRRNRLIGEPVANQTIAKAFAQLAKGFIPAGFKVGRAPKGTTLCHKLQETVNFKEGQWFKGETFNLAVGLIKTKTAAVNPAMCEGNGVLAVTFWPPLPLKAGQSSEILIAFRQTDNIDNTAE